MSSSHKQTQSPPIENFLVTVLIAFIFVALDSFTFGVVTSFAKWQLTHSFVEREAEVDPEVERNLSCHKLIDYIMY